MPLSPGDKLGPYDVVALLGKGGMGEVYRAHDAKLNRDVAIKVLPAALANDADYLARFQREAQTLAALNHPNIAMIFGIEGNAIVMELVEGETLKGPLPVAEALAIAKQIAEALEAAHDKGIIHRDLKPGNVKVTPEGIVKVLDFGLAKAVNERATQYGADSPTLTLRATEAGLILGTAGYMSPEQAAGKNVDRRADIWSFGVVLYELLTGKRMFDGETVSHTLAGVLKDEIDLTQIPEGPVRDLVRRCLDRNIKNRLQHIGEARIAIDNVGSAPAPAPITVPAKAGWWTWAAAVVALIAGVAIGWTYNTTRPAPLRSLVRLHAEIAADTPLARPSRGGTTMALSPDGTRLALILRTADGKARLHIRLLHQSQLTPLPATENAEYPFFSPDGAWIGFFAEGKLRKIAVEGGAPITLCDAPTPRGASWGDDGSIIAALDYRAGLWRVPDSGGTPESITKLNPGELTHRWPHVVSGSRVVLFTTSPSGSNTREDHIEALSLQTGERKMIQKEAFSPGYVPAASGPGHLIYLHQKTLLAAPFDLAKLAMIGAPVRVLEDAGHTKLGGGEFALSRNGTFAYLPGLGTDAMFPISSIEKSGKIQPLHAPLGFYSFPRFSPDGKRLAFSMSTGNDANIWVRDLDRDSALRLTFLPGSNRAPVWTNDGRVIVFYSDNPSAPGIYGIRSDGSGETRRLTEGKHRETPASFSPDGKRLAVNVLGKGGLTDIFTIPVEAEPGSGGLGLRLGKAEPFLVTPFTEARPRFSPDGRWMAYITDESGTFETYVRPFPGPGGRWKITSGGGQPNWSRDGRELLFHGPSQGGIMAVDYKANGDEFTAGKPRVWADVKLRNLSTQDTYDIAPDGKRLAAILADDAGEEKPVTHLTFLLNFADELQRRAPAGK